MGYKYAYQGYDEKKMARAVGISLPVSHKQCFEICRHIKHRSLERAKSILNNVLKKKEAVPYKRFNQDTPHRAGIAAGRYPRNSTREILKLIKAVEANANAKGITNELYITHMCVHKAPANPRSGRTPGESKRAHIEIVVEEKNTGKKEYKKKAKTGAQHAPNRAEAGDSPKKEARREKQEKIGIDDLHAADKKEKQREKETDAKKETTEAKQMSAEEKKTGAKK